VIARFAVPLLVLLALAAACGDDEDSSPKSTPTASRSASPLTSTPDAPGDTWETLAPMPTPRTEVAVAALDGLIYVIGGFEGDGSASDKVEVYDPATDTWSEAAPLPEARHHAAATGLGGPRVWVIGGFDASGGARAETFLYDPATNSWSAGEPLANERGAAAVARVDAEIQVMYVVGGARTGTGGGQENVGATESYVLDRGWDTDPDLPTPRDHLAAVGIPVRVYVFGGRLNGDYGQNVNTAQVYDGGTSVSDGTWRNLRPMPTARSGIAAVSFPGTWDGCPDCEPHPFGNTIYVFGGESPEGTFDENEMYDPATDTWTTMAPMPTPRHGLGAAVVGDKIYVIGGGPEPGLSVSGANEVYTPPR
jgi:Kelch motif protein/galactose oxidase-like protein